MKSIGLIFLILGIMLCIVGTIYTTDWTLIGFWIGGFLMVIVSVAIMFPRRKGMSIE
jgi:hypothetical protein